MTEGGANDSEERDADRRIGREELTSKASPSASQASGETVMLVDASNVSHGKTGFASPAKLDNLNRVLGAVREHPFRVLAVADASLRHRIDRRPELEGMFSSGALEQVPAATGADDFLWQLWKGYRKKGIRAYILTNDRFPQLRAKAESLPENPRVTYLLLDGDLVFQPQLESLCGGGGSAPSTAGEGGLRPPGSSRPNGGSISGSPTQQDPSGGLACAGEIPPATGKVSFSEVVGLPGPGYAFEADQEEDEGKPRQGELVDLAIIAVSARTDPPGGAMRRINFATIASDLHRIAGGNFVAKFGFRRPKDLALRMAEMGLVTISHTNTTMFIEPTPRLDEQAGARGLVRFQPRPIEPEVRTPGARTAEKESGETIAVHADTGFPDVLEIASREHGPTVEIAAPDAFLTLVRDIRPTHVFHWWSKRRAEDESQWKREGEFFFVLAGTTYRLSGRGYRSLADFTDGRARGMKGADNPALIGGPLLRDGSELWKTILDFHELDKYEDQPSEGDVYYFVRKAGFEDLHSLLAAEAAKPPPRDSY
ncbi:MAG: hypothetical protein L3J97_00605 [Thermoplasmata archaeon]|nr:hypothetical protein [Thermoplasmata archaeon]